MSRSSEKKISLACHEQNAVCKSVGYLLCLLPALLYSALTPCPSLLPVPASEKPELKVCSTVFDIGSLGTQRKSNFIKFYYNLNLLGLALV